MQIELTRDDVRLLLVCIDIALSESDNPILLADAKAMKARLEELCALAGEAFPRPQSIREHGRIANLVRATVAEMPVQFSWRDVRNHLERCGYSAKGSAVYAVLKRMPSLEVELVGRGKRGTKYRKKVAAPVQG